MIKLRNVNHISEFGNSDAATIFFDTIELGRRKYQVQWVIPGRTPESVQTGTFGKVFRSHITAAIWCRREAECYRSDNGGSIQGYAPNFDIWDAKFDF